MRAVFLALGLALLGACSDPEPAATPDHPAPAASDLAQPAAPAKPSEPVFTVGEYQCADGLLFNVLFRDQEATLHLDQQRFDLHRQPSASGALYADDHWNLFTKGERAMLSGADLTHECQLRLSRSVPASEPLPDVIDSLDAGEG